ncbi:MAG: NADH:ubiquinone oxidoreductase subunit NDUFA12 [Rhodobacterales bacterium]|nr:NADH:ubiquinone oxidoreductase subunit NDUFA12 [Rhodobacterales bacterium]
MDFLNTLKRVFTWWDGQTIGTQLLTWRTGVRVGEDAQGNVFYRNADDSRRWVIFKDEAEASKVNADWHGWLHKTFREPPTDRPLPHQPWQKPHQQNLTGTAMAYAPAGSIRRAEPQDRRDYEAWSPE